MKSINEMHAVKIEYIQHMIELKIERLLAMATFHFILKSFLIIMVFNWIG